MSDNNDIDNVRYSFESQEFFQRQLEQSVNELINKHNIQYLLKHIFLNETYISELIKKTIDEENYLLVKLLLKYVNNKKLIKELQDYSFERLNINLKINFFEDEKQFFEFFYKEYNREYIEHIFNDSRFKDLLLKDNKFLFKYTESYLNDNFNIFKDKDRIRNFANKYFKSDNFLKEQSKLNLNDIKKDIRDRVVKTTFKITEILFKFINKIFNTSIEQDDYLNKFNKNIVNTILKIDDEITNSSELLFEDLIFKIKNKNATINESSLKNNKIEEVYELLDKKIFSLFKYTYEHFISSMVKITKKINIYIEKIRLSSKVYKIIKEKNKN